MPPSSGLLVHSMDQRTGAGWLLATGAGVAEGVSIYVLPDGPVSTALAVFVGAVGVIAAVHAVRQTIPALRRDRQHIRAGKRLSRAARRSRRTGQGDQAAPAFYRAIVEGHPSTAAAGVVLLYIALDGPDGYQRELDEKRSPLWPAYLMTHADRARFGKDLPTAETLYEQAMATEHPLWGAAAAFELSKLLEKRGENVRAITLMEWASGLNATVVAEMRD